MKVIHWLLALLVLAGLLLLVQPDDTVTQSLVQRADEYRQKCSLLL